MGIGSCTIFGLIGFPLGHSWSPDWFNEKFKNSGNHGFVYLTFPLRSINEFTGLIRELPELSGLNVTIPYKEQIIPFLDELDDSAAAIGAVNTVKIIREQGVIKTIGFNTDAEGFSQSLDASKLPSGALILGSGGASKSVEFVLKRKNIRTQIVSRHKSEPHFLTYHDLSEEIMRKYLMIVNATPCGMFPDVHVSPQIPYNFLNRDHFLYDLIYNPVETAFLKQGKDRGTSVQNGYQMLINQAELSYRIFTENNGNPHIFST